MTTCCRWTGPLVLAALCGACANMEMTRSGFLPDYGQLRDAPEREVNFVPDEVDLYVAPGVDWARYDSVVVVPVESLVGFEGGPERALAPDWKVREELAWRFTEILEQTLARDFEVLSEPGPDTLLVRAAITDADPSNIWINWLGLFAAVPPDMGGISGEFEVLDAASGERLLAMTATRAGTPFLLLECFATWGHAHHGMKKWARGLRSMLRPEPADAE